MESAIRRAVGLPRTRLGNNGVLLMILDIPNQLVMVSLMIGEVIARSLWFDMVAGRISQWIKKAAHMELVLKIHAAFHIDILIEWHTQ